MGVGIVGHAVAVLPVEVGVAHGQCVLRDRIPVLIERIFIIRRNGVGLRRIVRGVLNCDQVLRGGTDGLNDAVVDHAVLEEIVPDAVIQGVLTGDLCKCVRPKTSHAQRKCEKECKNPHKYSFSVAKY